MIHNILWIIFYLITGILILCYLFAEKKVTLKLNELANKFYEKIVLKKEIKHDIIIGINILTSLIMLGIFIFQVNKAHSDILPFKVAAMYIILIINLVSLILNKKKDYLLIFNVVSLFIITNMVGIYDKAFKLILVLSLPFILLSIYLEKEKLKRNIQVLFNGLYLVILILILQSHYFGNYVIPTPSMEPTILVNDRILSNNVLYKFKNPQLNDIISFKEPLNNEVMYTKRITGIAGTVFKIENDRIYNDNKMINKRYYSTGRDSIYKLLGLKEIYIPKKGDFVSIAKVVEFDILNSKINVLEPQEFLKIVKGQDYSKIVGVYNNMQDSTISKRYTFVMTADGHDELMLPILDFKYDKKNFEKLLNGEAIKLKDDYYMAMGDNTDNSEDSRYFGYVKKSRIAGKLVFRWMPFNRIGKIKDEF